MRYQTKLLITACLLLALSLSAAGLAYWGVSQSHSYLSRSRIAHQELERQLQLSRHSQQLFKAWTDTLLTGISDRPLGAAYLHQVIESDLADLDRLTQTELAMVGSEERRMETAELDRLNAIKSEFQHALDQLGEVEQLRSRGRPDVAWSTLLALLKGGIDKKLNELIEVAVADETAEVVRIDADAARLLSRLEQISQIHAVLAILITLALVMLLLQRLRAPLAELLRGTRVLAEGDLSHRIAISGRDEFADLGQSEARGLGRADEPQPPDIVVAIAAHLTMRPRRFGKQAAPLIIANRFDTDAGRFRKPADRIRITHLIPYHGTEANSPFVHGESMPRQKET